MARRARVGVNGFGVIGKRVADAVSLQDDMELVGVADVVHDYRIRVAVERGYPVFASDPARRPEMEAAGIPVAGTLLAAAAVEQGSQHPLASEDAPEPLVGGGYNVIAFPLAAGVLYPFVLSPEVAALSMSGSTLVVAINALLLKRTRLEGIRQPGRNAAPGAPGGPVPPGRAAGGVRPPVTTRNAPPGG